MVEVTGKAFSSKAQAKAAYTTIINLLDECESSEELETLDRLTGTVTARFRQFDAECEHAPDASFVAALEQQFAGRALTIDQMKEFNYGQSY